MGCPAIARALTERSYELIDSQDLWRLSEIARADLADLWHRHPELAERYEDQVICITLAQGAALHYLDGTTGVHDFDIWTFFAERDRPFPARRQSIQPFGPSKFGIRRTVDLFGRSLPVPGDTWPTEAVHRYLDHPTTLSARKLAEKAVIGLWPSDIFAVALWTPQPPKKSRP